MGKLHCLDVGCSDATVIVSATETFLVDCHNIADYAYLLPSSKKIRGVFITHQHHDHFSGLEFLKDEGYSIGCLIYSPYERRYGDASVQYDEWNEFCGYRDHFESKGTALRAPFRQESFENPYWSIDGLKFWMLGPYPKRATSDTRCLHDACLVFRADLGERRCIFTGDSSDGALEEIAVDTTNICGDILHASHHGSINGADLTFIKKCNPKYTVISTAEDSYSNVPHPDALARYEEYTRKTVYRTDEFGSVVWTF
jgi:beta-lactamase superfamily II metal-dependent hydrolase